MRDIIHDDSCDGKCFGVMCTCGYTSCTYADSLDHNCPIARANQSFALFITVVTVAIVILYLTK